MNKIHKKVEYEPPSLKFYFISSILSAKFEYFHLFSSLIFNSEAVNFNLSNEKLNNNFFLNNVHWPIFCNLILNSKAGNLNLLVEKLWNSFFN